MFSVSPRAREMVCYRRGDSVQFCCQMDNCRTNDCNWEKSPVRGTEKFEETSSSWAAVSPQRQGKKTQHSNCSRDKAAHLFRIAW